jgi:hypothetical protein
VTGNVVKQSSEILRERNVGIMESWNVVKKWKIWDTGKMEEWKIKALCPLQYSTIPEFHYSDHFETFKSSV